MTDDLQSVDQPRSGATGFVLFVATLALVGTMIWQANAPERPAAAQDPADMLLGPVTGHEFGRFVQARVEENPEMADRSRSALELAEAAGDRPVVEAMAEHFRDLDLPQGR